MRCASEHAIYYHGEGAERLDVGLYVDDLVIIGNSNNNI
jgi:hypothetical protein